MRTVDLVYFEAGGGHRSAAQALQLVIARQLPWQTRLLNLQDVLDPIDVFRKLTGLRLQDGYNLMLKKNWTWWGARLLPLLHAVIRLWHADQVRLLEQEWRVRHPDLVVSLIPQFNRALCDSLRRAAPAAPFVTILTDLADCPPHFWMERQEQDFICGSERAVEQARHIGVPESRIHRTSGMILHPRFYNYRVQDRQAERERLGLDPLLPTGLVMFGGQGSQAMKEIARRLDRSNLKLQLIFICGHNKALEESLRHSPGRLRRYVLGYTAEVPYYMALSDFFIGKPGPGSISEALAMKLPVIVECNGSTLPQERYNADWILEKQVGVVIPNFRLIVDALSEFLKLDTYTRFHANAAALENRAVFEVVGILREILEG